jgi:DNA repair exonuclease SbcCD ATPase subunit
VERDRQWEEKFKAFSRDVEMMSSIRNSMEQKRLTTQEENQFVNEKLEQIENQNKEQAQNVDQLKQEVGELTKVLKENPSTEVIAAVVERLENMEQTFGATLQQIATANEKKGFWSKLFGK